MQSFGTYIKVNRGTFFDIHYCAGVQTLFGCCVLHRKSECVQIVRKLVDFHGYNPLKAAKFTIFLQGHIVFPDKNFPRIT